MSRARWGFTLIELLIVIAIIGILISAVAIAVTRALEMAKLNDMKANLKNLMTATRVIEMEFGRIPPAYGPYGRPPASAPTAQRTATVFVHLLPNLENKALFDNSNPGSGSVKVFQGALDPTMPGSTQRLTSYVANLRVFSTYGSSVPWNQPIPDLAQCRTAHFSSGTIPDGASNTLFFTTKYAVCNGVSNYFDVYPEHTGKNGPFFGAGSHAGGSLPTSNIPTGTKTSLPAFQSAPSLATTGNNVCNNDIGLFGHSMGSFPLAVITGDTSARTLNFTITGDTFAKALSPSDGQPLGNDW